MPTNFCCEWRWGLSSSFFSLIDTRLHIRWSVFVHNLTSSAEFRSAIWMPFLSTKWHDFLDLKNRQFFFQTFESYL